MSALRLVAISVTRLIGLWATFQSLWQQLVCPIYHILRQFLKGVKIFNFSSEIIFWATFTDIWQLFTGHTGHDLAQRVMETWIKDMQKDIQDNILSIT